MVAVRLPRATGWFVWAGRYGWTERVYLANEGDDPAWYTEGAFYWAQARSRLLGPNIVVARLVLSLRDTFRDALVVEPPAPPGSAGRTTYDPDMAPAGAPEPPAVRVVEKKWTADGLYSFQHYLNGFPRAFRTGRNTFAPNATWQRAYDFYRQQLLGNPADARYPLGRFGMKVAQQGPGAPPRVPVESVAWEGGTLTITAPGVNVQPGEWVRLSGIRGVGVVPDGLYLATPTSPDTFNVPLPVGPFVYAGAGGWVRRIVYQFAPYQGLALGQITALKVRTTYRPWTWQNLGPFPVPINPCGMVMGWGRGPPPRVKMRFYRDSDLESDVQWQVAAEGAQDFPLYHSFGPSLYMDRPSGPWAPLGEVEGTRVRSDVWAVSALRGKCYTGTADQWADGCFTTDLVGPLPACCEPPFTFPAPPLAVGLILLIGTPTMTLLWDLADGTPIDTDVVRITSDPATGINAAEVDPGHVQVSLLPASPSQAGAVSTAAQTFAGQKAFSDPMAVGNGTQGLLTVHGANATGGACQFIVQVDTGGARTTWADGPYGMTAQVTGDSSYVYLEFRGGTSQPTLAVWDAGGTRHPGVWGTSAAGDTVSAGLITALASSPGIPPTGPAGGSLSGTYPNPQLGTVTKGTIDGGTT